MVTKMAQEIENYASQYRAAADRNIELIKAALVDTTSPENIEELASLGITKVMIANLLRKDLDFINKDPELIAAFNRGKATVGLKVRASIVADALEKDMLPAKLHLDKVLNSEAQVQHVELSVKNETLKDVPTEDLIDIMYNKNLD